MPCRIRNYFDLQEYWKLFFTCPCECAGLRITILVLFLSRRSQCAFVVSHPHLNWNVKTDNFEVVLSSILIWSPLVKEFLKGFLTNNMACSTCTTCLKGGAIYCAYHSFCNVKDSLGYLPNGSIINQRVYKVGQNHQYRSIIQILHGSCKTFRSQITKNNF